MLLEALEYLTTPCPGWARSLGYLSEAIAIRHRARRCRADWAAHQACTKAAILRHCPDRCGKIVVLGAGLCLDIPVLELAQRTDQLILVDAVRLRGLTLPSNTRYETRDAHGAAERIHRGKSLEDRTPPLAAYRDADCILSVNLLSQLPILPLRALRARGLISSGQDRVLADQILREHVSDLLDHPGKTILIGDANHTHFAPGGSILENHDFTEPAGLDAPVETWTWPIVPEGEDPAFGTMTALVGVWPLSDKRDRMSQSGGKSA